jgi:hypothetical protein
VFGWENNWAERERKALGLIAAGELFSSTGSANSAKVETVCAAHAARA